MESWNLKELFQSLDITPLLETLWDRIGETYQLEIGTEIGKAKETTTHWNVFGNLPSALGRRPAP